MPRASLILGSLAAVVGLGGLGWWGWPRDEPRPVVAAPGAMRPLPGPPVSLGMAPPPDLTGMVSAPRAPEVAVLSTVEAARPGVLPHDGAPAVPPQPVALDRALRRADTATAPPPEPAEPVSSVLSDNGAGHTTYRDRQGRTALGEWRNASVGPAELGLPAYPGSLPSPGESTRVDESGLHSVSMTLITVDPPERVLAFYRAQLQQPGAVYQEQQASARQWLLSAADAAGQQVRRVLLVREGEQTTVTLVLLQTRARP
jgi:hypothetical protein